MKIAVCVKQVPSNNEVRLDPVTGTMIREGIEAILNPFDACAVEEAVRLKARFGGSITAYSMGIPKVDTMLRGILAVGVDNACLLTDRAFAGSDTIATARALAAAMRANTSPDLILCGKMAIDGDTAQVGPMIAAILGYAQITNVSRILNISRSGIEVIRAADAGEEHLIAPLPAVLTVTREINVPRLPSIAGILQSASLPIRHISAADLNLSAESVGLKGSRTRVVSSFRPDAKLKTEMLSGTAQEKAAALLEHLRADRLIGEDML